MHIDRAHLDIAVSAPHRVEQLPAEELDVAGQFDRDDAGDIDPAALGVGTEVTTPGALDKGAPVQTEGNAPPPQTPVEAPASTVPAVVAPDEDDAWLRDQLAAIARQLEVQGSRLQKLEEAMGRMGESRCLLEEQEKRIQDLTTRLREAEECQTAKAIMEPVVAGVIQIFDTVWSAQQEWKKQHPVNVDEWISNCLAALDGEIMAMLNRHGVVMIQDTTDVLNPGKQRVVRTEYPRQVQDGAVWALVRPGFYHNGRVARPEEVVVAKVKTGGAK